MGEPVVPGFGVVLLPGTGVVRDGVGVADDVVEGDRVVAGAGGGTKFALSVSLQSSGLV